MSWVLYDFWRCHFKLCTASFDMNFKETFLDLIGSLRNIMKDDAVVTKICHRSFENSEAIFRQLQKRNP